MHAVSEMIIIPWLYIYEFVLYFQWTITVLVFNQIIYSWLYEIFNNSEFRLKVNTDVGILLLCSPVRHAKKKELIINTITFNKNKGTLKS